MRWEGDNGREHFSLRFDKEEQLWLWEKCINRIIQEIQARRASEEAERAAALRSYRYRSVLADEGPAVVELSDTTVGVCLSRRVLLTLVPSLR